MPYPDVDSLPHTVREMLEGTPLNVVRMGAHASPPLFEAQGRLGWAVAHPAVLEPRLRETVVLRVAWLSASEYELHHHLPLARAAGLTDLEISALGQGDHERLEPLLAAAARFTDEVVTRIAPTDATLAALRKVASDQTVVNIVLAIGCYMSIARLAAVTGIEPDAQALSHLPSGPDERAR